jgi:ferredoxin
MASPWLMLRAFDMGCQGLVLISGEGKCHRGANHNVWEANVEFVKALLDSWDISSGRVELFHVSADSAGEVADGLRRFADEIAMLGTTQFRPGEVSGTVEGVLRLPELIRAMRSRSGCSSSKTISVGAVPFGKLSLDSSKCTGCGLCAADCPTDALTMGADKAGADYQLLFKQDACVGCGKCVACCPEKCLKLQRVLELDRIYGTVSELFRDDVLNCRRCGEPVAPISMIVHLKDKLRDSDSVLLEQLELCGRCKAETQRYKVSGKKVDLLAGAGMAYFTHDQAGQERSE